MAISTMMVGLVAQLLREQQVVIPCSGRITLWKPGNRAIQPVAEKHNVISFGKPFRDQVSLGRHVVVIQWQFLDIVASQVGYGLLPMLLEDKRGYFNSKGAEPGR